MVAVSQDIQWAFVGDKVTLEATSLSGDRARFKLTSKPFDSGLELYNADDQNYLEARGEKHCAIVPDAAGTYGITAMDEDVTVNVKHFSNDGGSGQSKGIATATALASVAYTLRVGQTLQREMGFGPDSATLTVAAHSSSSIAGVLTYHAGEGFVSKLSSSTSPIMDLAIRSTGVTKVLNYFGMSSGYTDTKRVITYASFTENPETTLARIVTGFNNHGADTTAAVHDAADAADKVTATVPTTEATLVTYVNDIGGKVPAHFAKATGAAHPKGADTTNALTALTATGLASARTLLIDIRNTVNSHRILNTTEAHLPPGDNAEDSLMPWTIPNENDSTSTVITFATGVVSAWDNHMDATAGAAGYHSAATTAANLMYTRTGLTWDELQVYTNDAIDKLDAHRKNRDFTANATAAYHTTPDLGGGVPFRAGDRKTTVQAIEYLHWTYLNHVLYGAGAWHSSNQNPGDGYVTPSGATERLQHELLDRLSGTDVTVPPNTAEEVNYFLGKAGFDPTPEA